MDIFNTTYETIFKDSLKAIRYKLLLKLAGEYADRFECLKPLPNQNVLGQTREWRKAKFVDLLIEILLAGGNPASIPAGCSCEQLAGTLCGWADQGFRDIIATIEAIEATSQVVTQTVQFGSVNTVEENLSYVIAIPEGKTLIAVTTTEPAATIESISGVTGSVTVTLTGTVAGSETINYSYA
jgi:hypothetical protein